MKIIFSRKGFDSQYGQVPSPILSDGSLQTFPIPSRYGRPLGDIQGPLGPLHGLVSDLTGGTINALSSVHLDPDLNQCSLSRSVGWRASFGQVGAAQQHLANQKVGPGDVFLFFGWFRRAEHVAGRWRYVPRAPDLHVLFGWLRVGAVLKVGTSECPEWLGDHPHMQHARSFGVENTIYVAAEGLGGTLNNIPGAGVFRRWGPHLQLTLPGRKRSMWRVPSWLLSNPEQPTLSYHRNPERWCVGEHGVLLQTVSKGQEFVIDVGDSKEPREWVQHLVLHYGTPTESLV